MWVYQPQSATTPQLTTPTPKEKAGYQVTEFHFQKHTENTKEKDESGLWSCHDHGRYPRLNASHSRRPDGHSGTAKA